MSENEPELEVPRTGTRGDPCSSCGSAGSWSSVDPSALYTPPPGHTVLRDDELRVSWELCWRETEVTMLRSRAPRRSCRLHGDNGCEVQGEAGSRERCHERRQWQREVSEEADDTMTARELWEFAWRWLRYGVLLLLVTVSQLVLYQLAEWQPAEWTSAVSACLSVTCVLLSCYAIHVLTDSQRRR